MIGGKIKLINPINIINLILHSYVFTRVVGLLRRETLDQELSVTPSLFIEMPVLGQVSHVCVRGAYYASALHFLIEL